MIQPILTEYLAAREWAEIRQLRFVDGLRVLQAVASNGVKPLTNKEFGDRVVPKTAPLATNAVLEDIGQFCAESGWPNVTCFVVSRSTGEVSASFKNSSDQAPAAAREAAWLAYAAYKTGIRVDVADAPADAPADATV